MRVLSLLNGEVTQCRVNAVVILLITLALNPNLGAIASNLDATKTTTSTKRDYCHGRSASRSPLASAVSRVMRGADAAPKAAKDAAAGLRQHTSKPSMTSVNVAQRTAATNSTVASAAYSSIASAANLSIASASGIAVVKAEADLDHANSGYREDGEMSPLVSSLDAADRPESIFGGDGSLATHLGRDELPKPDTCGVWFKFLYFQWVVQIPPEWWICK